ncbi:chaperonin 10-like protein [Infundibulicybe gibba]|nr:chaperonin 10-like protein [Infundibulicybe gibba]
MSKTHTAVALTSPGVVAAIQVPTPTPGPGEVLVRVAYASLMAFDAYLVDHGFLNGTYPVGLGLNAAGVVREVGPGVRDMVVGDRVSVYTVHGPEGDLKSMQEYVLVPTRVVAKIPHTLPMPEAATIPDNFITAFYTLFNQLGLPVPSYPVLSPPAQAEEPILVYGAGATSGQFALQLLRRAGYTHVIATASPAHHEYLRKLGAAHVLDYRSSNIAAEIVKAAGKKVTLAVDAVTAEGTLKIIAAAVSDSARVAILLPIKEGKAVTGPRGSQLLMSIPEDRNPFARGVEVVYVRTFLYDQDTYLRENLMPKVLPELLELGIIEPNRVRLLDGDVAGLKDRAEAALDMLRNNRVSGEKLVLAIAGGA